MSRIEVLVATMNLENPNDLYQKMNLKTDALIINQTNYVSYDSFIIDKSLVQIYSFNERGLSKSRNNALMRSNGEILIISDDDVVYTDTYQEDILNEFDLHPEADAIVFNLNSNLKERAGKKINKFARVGLMESREYGSVHIAFRRNSIISRNVYFNTLFGSGSIYNCGEDTIFLKDLIIKGLKLYKSPINIGEVDMSESSWFSGYNEKYYFNKGALITCMYPNYKYLLFFIQALRNSIKNFGNFRNFFRLFSFYLKGSKDYTNKYRE